MEHYLIKPSLIENSTKYYISHSLKQTRALKDKYITIGVNIGLFILLISGIAALLLYKYRGKLSPYESHKKDYAKKMYIYKKLQQYSHNKLKENQNLITNLPLLEPNNNYTS
jgi:glucan phosphoethanolaminetransferase (alkaline phosphatase superfamily)